jgi:hypothetical protein
LDRHALTEKTFSTRFEVIHPEEEEMNFAI